MQDNKKNKKFDINEETKEFEFVYKYQTPKENENILLKDIQNNKNEQNRIKNLLNTSEEIEIETLMKNSAYKTPDELEIDELSMEDKEEKTNNYDVDYLSILNKDFNNYDSMIKQNEPIIVEENKIIINDIKREEENTKKENIIPFVINLPDQTKQKDIKIVKTLENEDKNDEIEKPINESQDSLHSLTDKSKYTESKEKIIPFVINLPDQTNKNESQNLESSNELEENKNDIENNIQKFIENEINKNNDIVKSFNEIKKNEQKVNFENISIDSKSYLKHFIDQVELLKKNTNYYGNLIDLKAILEKETALKGLKQLKLFLKTTSLNIFSFDYSKYPNATNNINFLISLWEKYSWMNNSKSNEYIILDDNSIEFLIKQIVLEFHVLIYKKIGLQYLLLSDINNYNYLIFNDVLFLNNEIRPLHSISPKNSIFSKSRNILMEIFNNINIQNKESYELRKEKIILSFKKIFANKKPIKLENFDFVFFKSNLYKKFNEIFFKKVNVYTLINNNEINIAKLDVIIFTNFIEYWNLSTKIEKDENDNLVLNVWPTFIYSLYILFANFFKFEIEESLMLKEPNQWLIYGAPGTGKTYMLSNLIQKYNKNIDLFLHRKYLNFYSETNYSNFIGKTKSYINEEGKTIFQFMPGDFIKMLSLAYKNPDINYVLIIEDINKADYSNIFGEFYQLLDRNNSGNSYYYSSLNKDLINYFINEEKIDINNPKLNKFEKLFNYLGNDDWEIKLPYNFYIWATINGEDKSDKTIDATFKRKWTLKFIDFDLCPKKPNIFWNEFRRNVNEKLISIQTSGDKLLGYWYINDLIGPKSKEEVVKKAIKNKVIPYLFDLVKDKKEIFSFNEYKFNNISLINDNFNEWWAKYKNNKIHN